MGYSSAHAIQGAGKYLLSRLMEANKLPYSTFYDGTDATHEQLKKSIGQEDDWHCSEHLIDLAVHQLEEQEIVAVQELTAKLADEENDYLIELTDEGRDKIAGGYEPSYRMME